MDATTIIVAILGSSALMNGDKAVSHSKIG